MTRGYPPNYGDQGSDIVCDTLGCKMSNGECERCGRPEDDTFQGPEQLPNIPTEE